MIHLTEEERCTGCAACMQKCGKQAISMRTDRTGFAYPVIDQEKCVKCGICEKICPVMNKKGSVDLEAYAAYIKNDAIRLRSSSGGIFSAIAEKVIEQNGIVYGAAFDDEMNVHHIGVETRDDLEKLRGSKYVQSDIGNSYKEAEANLKRGRMVLFSGTPCQIAGLKAYLGAEYDKLISIDILCHGVPSIKLWHKYLDMREKEKKDKVKQTFFRHKNWGWKKYALELQFCNSKAYLEKFSDDMYMQLFLKNIALRSSCYDCDFREGNYASDITIGDFWGIEKVMPEMDDDKGTSAVIIHTEKGRDIFRRIAGIHSKKTDLDCIAAYNPVYRKSVEPHPRRKACLKRLARGEQFNRLYSSSEYPILFRIVHRTKREIIRAYKKFK